MDGYKALIPLLLILITGTATSVSFEASISPEANITVRETSFIQNSSGLQTVNLSVINTGSVGCSFQLETVFNNSETAYSREKPVWPGESTFLESNHLFKESGSYKGVAKLDYCGEKLKLSKFNFTTEKANFSAPEVNSTTLTASENRVNFTVEEGLLVPVETPYFWKVSSAETVNGTASVGLKPSIFDRDEEIRFAVLNQSTGSVKAFTNVSMRSEVEETWIDSVTGFLDKYSFPILAVSTLLNFLLAGFVLKVTSWEDIF
ncbi:MAG: hypothetical protein ABEJ93_01955 [Candidatus Nanohalobium sp.]